MVSKKKKKKAVDQPRELNDDLEFTLQELWKIMDDFRVRIINDHQPTLEDVTLLLNEVDVLSCEARDDIRKLRKERVTPRQVHSVSIAYTTVGSKEERRFHCMVLGMKSDAEARAAAEAKLIEWRKTGDHAAIDTVKHIDTSAHDVNGQVLAGEDCTRTECSRRNEENFK